MTKCNTGFHNHHFPGSPDETIYGNYKQPTKIVGLVVEGSVGKVLLAWVGPPDRHRRHGVNGWQLPYELKSLLSIAGPY